jgi:hypothetical protein
LISSGVVMELYSLIPAKVVMSMTAALNGEGQSQQSQACELGSLLDLQS